MKSFKQFLIEEKSVAEMNKMLKDYTSGAIENYDNKGTFMSLFDPNGQGLPKLLSNFNLVILDKHNGVFDGKGKLVQTHMDFNLSIDTETTPTKKLHVELTKLPDSDYIIKIARII